MSHFVCIQTQIREEKLLVDCLGEMGFSNVERHESAQPLFGYEGGQRAEAAEVIIRRKFLGWLSNDIGFKRKASGDYEAIIFEFDRARKYSDRWFQELNRRYAYKVVMEQAREQYLIVEEQQTLENGDVVILLSERG